MRLFLNGIYFRIQPKVNQLPASHLSLKGEISWQEQDEEGNRKNKISFSEIANRLGINLEFQREPDRQPYLQIARTCASERPSHTSTREYPLGTSITIDVVRRSL